MHLLLNFNSQEAETLHVCLFALHCICPYLWGKERSLLILGRISRPPVVGSGFKIFNIGHCSAMQVAN